MNKYDKVPAKVAEEMPCNKLCLGIIRSYTIYGKGKK